MNQLLSQNISCIAFYLNPEFCSEKHFSFKSDDGSLLCVKRGPFPMIYLSKTHWSCDNNLESIISILINLYHLGLLKFSDYFRYRYEDLYRWLKSNINSVIAISSITFQWQYKTDNYLQELSPFETNYLRNNNLWTVYNQENYIPKRKRNNQTPLTIQQFTLDQKYGARFLYDVNILNGTNQDLWLYFGDYILKSWRRHCANGLLPLPMNMMKSGRISHSQLPKKIA